MLASAFALGFSVATWTMIAVLTNVLDWKSLTSRAEYLLLHGRDLPTGGPKYWTKN